jgi:phosphonoacetate hydrolase
MTVVTGHSIAAEHEEDVERALAVLLDAALEPIVEMVLLRRDGAYEALAHDGAVRFRRAGHDFETLGVEGRNPLAHQDAAAFSPLAHERANLHPHRTQNSYPYAYEQVAQLFDSPAAPDLCVIHTGAHNWEDQGGHLGEHGSIGVVQARAPFLLGGKGVRERGFVDASARLVDVAPTIAALLGCRPEDPDGGASGTGTYLRLQDGRVLDELLDPAERPRHVVGFLFDGTNANVLYDMIERGEAPNVARILERGAALRHGAMAALPTVTLANHTSILTGAFPGHHGILHNAWYDRSQGRQIVTNSPATWPTAMTHLAPGTDSLAAAVQRSFAGDFTATINEPCDVGAAFSTFDLIRNGEPLPLPKPDEQVPYATERFVRPSKDYRWSSVIDNLCVEQATGIWDGDMRGVAYPRPRFMWCNFTLTDAAMHEGGPHSEIAAAAIRDSDARVGEIMAAIERAGAFDDTAFLLVADHGMEETDRSCTGDWDVALSDAGVAVRDEGYGFLYFGT